jgi:glutamate-ammonia-ligase adenylyltransferase
VCCRCGCVPMLPATRCSADWPTLRRWCSGTGRRSAACLRARSGWPTATPTRTRRSGSARPRGACRGTPDDEGTRCGCSAVLGASTALADHLVRHPDHWRELTDPRSARPAPRRCVRPSCCARWAPTGRRPRSRRCPTPRRVDALRVEYRRLLLGWPPATSPTSPGRRRRRRALRPRRRDLEAALAVARPGRRDAAPDVRLAVIAMGKCGGRELNYVSDVDVVFVAEPVDGVDETPRRSGRPPSWPPPDADLLRATPARARSGRSTPRCGPRARPARWCARWPATVAYYERWAKTWEFQALLKARPVAGDLELGAAYVEMVEPLVWEAAERDGFVEDVQAMRRRVESSTSRPRGRAPAQARPGGLRDVEFAVQLLQLVHGRADPAAAQRPHAERARALSTGGYVGRDDGGRAAAPTASCAPSSTGSSCTGCGARTSCPRTRTRCAGSAARWACARTRSRSSTAVAHTPRGAPAAREALLPAAAHAVARLGPTRRGSRRRRRGPGWRALGYADPAGALRHLEALTSGVSRGRRSSAPCCR